MCTTFTRILAHVVCMPLLTFDGPVAVTINEHLGPQLELFTDGPQNAHDHGDRGKCPDRKE